MRVVRRWFRRGPGPASARRPWTLALPLAVLGQLVGCGLRGCGEPQAFSDEGGELGRRVRQGELPGVSHHRFHSEVIEREVGLVVVTPPGYAEQPQRQYPVVYLFPGLGGNEWSYLYTAGRDSSELRRLFADPERAPLVVFAHPGDSGGHGRAERVLGEELIAFVDDTYRTRREATARSLQGFSLGGATALSLLSAKPHVFGRALAASSACYLIDVCGDLREALRRRAGALQPERLLLAFSADEDPRNKEINQELGQLVGVQPVVLPGVGHDLAAQLEVQVGEQTFGERVAEFHLQGFGR